MSVLFEKKSTEIYHKLNDASLIEKKIHVLYKQRVSENKRIIQQLEEKKVVDGEEYKAVDILTQKLLKTTEDYNEMIKANERPK